ncbi:lysophospholipase [Lachnospiraceae bacterium KM106-2]|nr:lysophospholipase [Lachnospiraceae bacterium KM106-2]
MINKQEYYLPSTNGVNKLHVVKWEPVGEVTAILQISHGMVEFINRYDRFANYLAERGILVIGNDHLGHGFTAANDDELGFFPAEDGSKTVVSDLYQITKHAKGEHPGVPYYLLGHSMGSFMARRYLMTYGKELDGAIIMGTGNQPKAVIAAGKMVAGLISVFKGKRHRSKLMNTLSFGAYNKQFKPVRTSYDWLTKDETIVDAYAANKYCTYLFTLNGYQTLFNTFSFIMNKKNIQSIPKELPLFFVAGAKDPVGVNGKEVRKIYEQYKKMGIRDCKIKLYDNCRHEILNELEYETVYEDLYKWIIDKIATK